MREKIFSWLGHEFIALSCEGNGDGSITEETARIFQGFHERLRSHGLDLDNTTRTRLWARDMVCWEGGVQERARLLSGAARSVSSSHIRPDRFASPGRISVDLLAMAAPSGSPKILCEYEPSGLVLRYLDWGNIVFLSGVTVVLPHFDAQLQTIVGRIEETLKLPGLNWTNVARASFFLHRSCSMSTLRQRFAELVPMSLPLADYCVVDTRQEKLVEIEITAER